MNRQEFEKEYLGKFDDWPYQIYVVARTYQEARLWQKESGCPNENFHYVSRADALKGIRGGQFVLYGQWYLRNDAESIGKELDLLVHLKRLEQLKLIK